jgi:hypothetical protein
MTHIHEDELTLYYYGEGRHGTRIERHLHECPACATLYREIAGTLAMVVADELPERSEQYGLEVWQRIRPHLEERQVEGFGRFAGFGRLGWFSGRWQTLTLAAGVAVLVVAAFVTGYVTRSGGTTDHANRANPANPAGIRHRILLASVADHLDRSERVLTDIMNVGDAAASDISTEQRWAEDLLTTSRLYRQDAVDAGEQSVASVLDDLERNLLEIVHSPSRISAADLEQIRRRIDAAALLFKVRVLSDDLRERETSRADRPASKTSTSHTS